MVSSWSTNGINRMKRPWFLLYETTVTWRNFQVPIYAIYSVGDQGFVVVFFLLFFLLLFFFFCCFFFVLFLFCFVLFFVFFYLLTQE